MKRSRKTLFALLLALVMTLGLAATAWATEGGVTVDLSDGFIEQNPNDQPMDPLDPEYKIHFTKVVEQAGTCAPGKETFKFEAVNHVIDAAAYPEVQRSVEIETNGAGTYQGTLTITGPAVQVQNFVGRGFYVREVQGNDQCWTYSNKEYYVAFDIDNTTREPMLTFYLNNEEVSEMTFENIYTENLRTVEIPFTKTVKLGGSTGPGTTDFTIAVCDVNAHGLSYYTDVTYKVVITTNGAGSYDGKLAISGPATQVGEFISEGFYVREVKGDISGWTYSDAVWCVKPVQLESGPQMQIYPAKMEKTPNGEFYDVTNNADAVGKMTFENTYTYNTSYTTPDVKPISSPKTIDAGVALYGVSALLSLTGTALVIKRKNG